MPEAPSDRYGLRAPVLGDSPNVPLDIKNLRDDIEANLGVLMATRDIKEVGQLNQTRAGRVLIPSDFLDLGLGVPAGLWNLSDLTDVSGNARALNNKGAVPFGKGITGAAAEAAVFAGSTAQALWRADEAALSIRSGSWGCWFRTARRGVTQSVVTKASSVAGQRSYSLTVLPANYLEAAVYSDGTSNFSVTGSTPGGGLGTTDVADDRWHFAVCTYDGTTLRLYVDGRLESSAPYPTPAAQAIFDGTAPFNIGSFGADLSNAAVNPFYGRIDEAFLTPDVLTLDQIRILMSVKIYHGTPRTPRHVNLSVRRHRKGATQVAADYTDLGLAQPVRLYNLDGSFSDLGSAGVILTANGGAGVGVFAGPAGRSGGAASFDGVDDYLSSTDAGLPGLLTPRTLLAWFKVSDTAAIRTIMSYGTNGTAETWLYVNSTTGALVVDDGVSGVVGPAVADGEWHFAATTWDNAAADGAKRKLYLDGRCVAIGTTLQSTTLAGANAFRIGARNGGTAFFKGQIARAAVLAEVMTPDQIAAIWAKGTQDLGRSPYPAGDYVERLSDNNVYVLVDRSSGSLQDQEKLELEVRS